MQRTHFTADSHFGHGNILKFCNRPFKSIKEHDETLISNWNSVVGKKDIVYHGGDFGLCNPGYLKTILNRLNGNIHLIVGNHDKTALQISKSTNVKKFASISETKYITVEGQKIFICHYALRTWRGSYHGAYMLFGHSHGRMPPLGKSFDIGVDCWNYTPINFEQVKEKMDTLKYRPFGDENMTVEESKRLRDIAIKGK